MSIEQVPLGETLALKRSIYRCPDPIALFSSICAGGQQAGTLLLETAETSSGVAGKSLIIARSALRISCRGFRVEVSALNRNGEALLPWLSVRLKRFAQIEHMRDRLFCEFNSALSGSEEMRLKAPSPINVLRELLQGSIYKAGEPALSPLIAGVFAYDFIDCYEQLPPSAVDLLNWPNMEFWLADRLIWLDHQRGTTTVVTHLFGADRSSHFHGDAISSMAQLVDAVERTAQTSATREPPPVEIAASVDVDMDDTAYAHLVEKLKQHIICGDVFQIVPSRTFSIACHDPLAAYRRLRSLNPSPYMFYVHSSCGVLFGASPETAIKVEGSPLAVQIRPIAGTRQRGRSPDGQVDHDLDGRLEAELRLNDKELAEHMMLVDLARNDVARVSEPGTRYVEKLLQVERYSHVMHLVSHVTGMLRRDLDALHAYVATMNMGTLVGAPKIKAAELLRRYEKTKRGTYGGAVGYLTADGRMDMALIIRAAIHKEGRAYVRAGAGVVYDSDPMAEALETRRKAEAVLTAIRQIRPE